MGFSHPEVGEGGQMKLTSKTWARGLVTGIVAITVIRAVLAYVLPYIPFFTVDYSALSGNSTGEVIYLVGIVALLTFGLLIEGIIAAGMQLVRFSIWIFTTERSAHIVEKPKSPKALRVTKPLESKADLVKKPKTELTSTAPKPKELSSALAPKKPEAVDDNDGKKPVRQDAQQPMLQTFGPEQQKAAAPAT